MTGYGPPVVTPCGLVIPFTLSLTSHTHFPNPGSSAFRGQKVPLGGGRDGSQGAG